MARGESPTPPDRPIGVAFLGVFGVAALGALLFVVVVTRACDSCDEWLYGYGGMPADPYVGASTAASLLGWRDVARLRYGYGAPPTLDGPAAAVAVRVELRAHGFAEPSATLGPFTLPADVDVPALDRTCGLIVFEAEATSRIDAAGRPAGLRAADDPSLVTTGACGRGPFRVEGVGTALVRVILVPGLVEDDPLTTGLPEDVLLAHVEAEHLLRSVGYVPSDQVLRIDAPSPPVSGDFTGLPVPASGCVPWAVVVVGAGRTRSGTASMGQDFATQRGLGLAISCAGASTTYLSVTDDATTGWVAWARPYAASGAPSMPTPTERSTERVRVVDVADLVPPTAIQSVPPP
jgi:hypothetical protein